MLLTTVRRRRHTTTSSAITHRLQRLGEVRLDAPVTEVSAGLLDPLDLSRHTPAIALVPEAAAYDVHHGVVQLGVEAPALADVLFVAAFEAAVRVQVATELEQQVEGVAGAGGEGGEALDVREELQHAG